MVFGERYKQLIITSGKRHFFVYFKYCLQNRRSFIFVLWNIQEVSELFVLHSKKFKVDKLHFNIKLLIIQCRRLISPRYISDQCYIDKKKRCHYEKENSWTRDICKQNDTCSDSVVCCLVTTDNVICSHCGKYIYICLENT